MRHLLLSLAVVAVLSLGSVAARAQALPGDPRWPSDAFSESPDEQRAKAQEERIKPAAAMLGLATGVATAAGVTYGISQRGEKRCGPSGCFRHPDIGRRLAAGSLFATAGGMAAVALPTLLDAMLVTRGPLLRPGRAGWGMAMTSIGLGQALSLCALGVGYHRLKDRTQVVLASNRRPPEWPDRDAVRLALMAQGLLAATHLGVGIPLWASGGRAVPGTESAEPLARAAIVPTGTGLALEGSF